MLQLDHPNRLSQQIKGDCLLYIMPCDQGFKRCCGFLVVMTLNEGTMRDNNLLASFGARGGIL